MSIVSKELIAIRSCFQIVGTATENIANIQLSFRKRKMLTNDLRVLEISEKCSRLTKYVGYLVESVRCVTVAVNSSQFKFNSEYTWKPM